MNDSNLFFASVNLARNRHKRAAHECRAQHLEQIIPMLVHGIEVRADITEVYYHPKMAVILAFKRSLFGDAI